MAEDEIVAGAVEKRAHVSVPRPIKRWRVLVVGRAGATLMRESPGDRSAAIAPDRRLKASEGPKPRAARAD